MWIKKEKNMPNQRGIWKIVHQTLIMVVSDLEQSLLYFLSGLGLGLGEWDTHLSCEIQGSTLKNLVININNMLIQLKIFSKLLQEKSEISKF